MWGNGCYIRIIYVIHSIRVQRLHTCLPYRKFNNPKTKFGKMDGSSGRVAS